MKEHAEKYFEILNNELKGLNLTSHESPEEIYNKQFIDTLTPFKEFSYLNELILNSTSIIDVGFGGGFPIIPLSLQYKDKKFVGIETRAKKVRAVELICNLMNIKNVKLISARMEDCDFDIEGSLVVNKAVGTIKTVLEYLNPSANIRVLFYKGPGFDADEAQYIDDLKEIWSVEKKIDFELPNIGKRTIIVFKNREKISVPRRTKLKVKISKI